MANEKTAPGIVKMRCMIGEPTPMVERIKEEQSFTYNAGALGLMKGWNTPNISGHDKYVSLTEKYVYYDTFLFDADYTINKDKNKNSIGTINLYNPENGPMLTSIYMKDFNAEEMFFVNNSFVSAKKPWMYHQSFYHMKEGLFLSSDITTPFWTYNALNNVGFNKASENQEEFDTSKTKNEGYTAIRKDWRAQPGQVCTTKTKPDTAGVATTNAAQGATLYYKYTKPVHWMVRKLLPLFMKEDFFVQFTKLSNTPDDVGSLLKGFIPLNPAYAYLDAEARGFDSIDETAQTRVPVNLGVVQIDSKGNIINDDSYKLNIRKQPYYAVELNAGDEESYWLIIPWSGYPALIEVSKNVLLFPGTDTTPPVLHNPSVKVSRLLGTYDVSGSTLMSQDNLRITFQNHLNNIVITFNGHEDNPWVVEGIGYDYGDWLKNRYKNEEISSYKRSLVIKNRHISIAAGNIPCGFTFSPLHYEPVGFIEHQQSISVHGPVEDSDINLLLSSKQKKDNNAKSETNVYNQEADLYVEVVSGQRKETNAKTVLSAIKKPGETLSELESIRAGGWTKGSVDQASYIWLQKTALSQPALLNEDINKGYEKYLPKSFSARCVLGAGSVTSDGRTNNSLYRWQIPNCITPISTGWTLSVPASTTVIKPYKTAVDVAQHVTQFSLSTSFSDNAKVEKSGTIRFIINPGTMTGLYQSSKGQADNQNIDRSAILSNLAGKTFTIRVYAWWEDGFMDCSDSSCPCKNGSQPGQGGNKKVVFTGLCHGGQITVENGKRYMDCQLLDYWKILQDSKFLNSPYFDGMRDFNALAEIISMAGFAGTGNLSRSQKNSMEHQLATAQNDPWPPAMYIEDIASSVSNEKFFSTSIGGESFEVKSFGLPSSYDILQSPRFRFADTSAYDEAILQIARIQGYMVYFDRYGIFRYTPRSDQRACKQGINSVKCNFYASPVEGSGTGCRNYDSLAFNSYVYNKKVSDAFNDIHMVTTTPRGEIVIASEINLRGKFDDGYDGYIGYTKRFMQMDGIFGSAEAVAKTAKYYSAFFYPPITVQWEGFGQATLNAGDIVTFTGLQIDNTFPKNMYNSSKDKTTLLYLTSVTMDINPEKNDWKNKYEGEWIFFDCNNLQNA